MVNAYSNTIGHYDILNVKIPTHPQDILQCSRHAWEWGRSRGGGGGGGCNDIEQEIAS